MKIPVAPARRQYHGIFQVRADKRVRRALAIEAERAEVSLNALVAEKLAKCVVLALRLRLRYLTAHLHKVEVGHMERARINGIEIAYQLRGEGAPLVMIHGAQGDQTTFDGLAAEFSDRYRVLTFDQRGSGLSDKPDMPYSIAMLADDTVALMDHLGLAPAHVLGVSMGGTIAQEVALHHRAKVISLVLGCTTPGGPKAIRLGGPALTSAYSTQSMTAEERGKALAEAAFTKGYLARHPEIIESMIAARRARPIDSAVFAHRMKAVVEHDAYDRLPQIHCPTLVITGKDDALVNWENSRLIADRIQGAKLVVLEPAGHSFWVEQPEQTSAVIADFLANVS